MVGEEGLINRVGYIAVNDETCQTMSAEEFRLLFNEIDLASRNKLRCCSRDVIYYCTNLRIQLTTLQPTSRQQFPMTTLQVWTVVSSNMRIIILHPQEFHIPLEFP